MLGFDLDSAASLCRFQTQFEDFGKIGSGGFSTVHRVRNKKDHKMYALKTVKIKPSQFKGEVADYLEKVLGQARVLSSLKHPNILQYHGCWVSADLKADYQTQEEQQFLEEDEQLEMVVEEFSENSCGFEFERRSSSIEKKKKLSKSHKKKNRNQYKQNPNDNIFGTDLNKYRQIRVYVLSQLGEFSLQKHVNLRNHQNCRKNSQQLWKARVENYKILLDIIEGLSYIHSQKIIHRDIKLQNIVIDSQSKCKIIDFGLAKKTRNFKSQTFQKFSTPNFVEIDGFDEKHSSSVGTKIFSSPQQTNSENYDYRTDIYSLGMVIGVLFSSYSTAHQEAEILMKLRNKRLQDFQIDNRLKKLLSRCLSEQKERPDLRELKMCIKNLLKQEIQSERENSPQSEKSKKEVKGQKREKQQNRVILSQRDLEVSC